MNIEELSDSELLSIFEDVVIDEAYQPSGVSEHSYEELKQEILDRMFKSVNND